MPDTRPNFLIIMSDEHDPQISSPYGHPFVETPAMQHLADRGVTFQNSYCNSPLCVPSRASFMTGQHLYRIGVWDNGTPLASDEPTWAHRLNALGYDTALAGKMHFIGPDQRHGFRERLVEDVHGTGRYGPPDWSKPVTPGHERMRQRLTEAGPGDSRYQQYDDEVTARSVAYLRDPARRERPWALCASFITPHFPLTVRAPYFVRYFPIHADMPVISHRPLEQLHPAHQRLLTYFNLFGHRDEDIARARAVYYGLVTFFDEKLGELLDALDETGQTERTVVIYLADHGEMHGEHGLWWKCTFFEQSARIPTIISWPGHYPSGQRRNEVISLIDVVRTIVDVAGANDQRGLDGDSLVPLLTGQNVAWKDLALAEYEGHGTLTPARMVRRGRYKMNYYYREPAELFDLESDPGERVNLAGNPDYRAIEGDLTSIALDGWNPQEIARRVHESQLRRQIVDRGEVYTAPARD